MYIKKYSPGEVLDFHSIKNVIKFFSAAVVQLEMETASDNTLPHEEAPDKYRYIRYDINNNPTLSCLETDYPEALETFNDLFEGVQNPLWTTDESGLNAFFYLKENLVQATFNPEGKIITRTTFFNPKDYPAHVIEEMGQNFPGYSIYSVKEQVTAYVKFIEVILKKDSELFTIKLKNKEKNQAI